MARVLITGGSGLIGQHLCKKLQEKGYDVAILTRSRKKETEILTYTWDLNKNEIEKEAIDTADFIIHLAGEDIGKKRWTARRKQQIVDSRIKSGQLVFNKIREYKKDLKAFISASAVGYYGFATSDKIFSETDMPAKDFLGQTCRKWEQMSDRFVELEVRTVKIRTGVVLTKTGGALSKMMIPIKMGIGSAIGNGKQFIPWIHIDDLCGIYIKAIEDSNMNGAYNAVAPDQISNMGFTRTLAGILNKPFWFPSIPAIVMKILFGQMSDILLKGNRVSADKIQATGYKFLLPNLEGAFKELIE